MTGQYMPNNDDEIYDACMYLMDKKGDEFIKELIKEHPDYDLITKYTTKAATKSTESIQNSANEAINELKVEFDKLKSNLTGEDKDTLLKYGFFAIIAFLILKSF